MKELSLRDLKAQLAVYEKKGLKNLSKEEMVRAINLSNEIEWREGRDSRKTDILG